jgi:Mg/Co/Ni transporter MgtE
MTRIQTRILELFETLSADERAEFLDRLAAQGPPSFFDRMTAEQRAELDRSIAEADRGEGKPAADLFAEIAAKHGLVRQGQ